MMEHLLWIFKEVLYLGATASILIVLILLTKKLFNNFFSAKWHYYIWILLIIRLLIPYNLESPVSIYNLFYIVAERANVTMDVVRNSIDDTNINENIKNISDSEAQYTHDDEIISDTAELNQEIPVEVEDKSAEEPSLVTEETSNMNFIFNIAAFIWLFVVVLISIYMIFINIGFAIHVRKSYTLLKDERIINILEECKRTMKIRSSITLFTTKKMRTPTLYVLFGTKILISEHYMQMLSDEEIRYIFFHELSHYKRKDILVNWILVLLQIIYFFNPLIWYAFRKIHEDCEIACDGMALNYIREEEHQRYGNTIIKLIKFFSETNFIPVTAGIGKSKSNYKRRIVMVSKYKKSKWTNTLLSLILICSIGIIGLTGCNLVKKDDGNSDIPKELDSSENATQTPESDNSSQTMPEEDTIENEEQAQVKYLGDWFINKVQAFGVGTYSEEDAENLIGREISFTEETASVFGDQLADVGSKVENPRYTQTVMSEEDFIVDYRIPLSLLGIESKTVTVINVSYSDNIVSTFLVKDDNTLILIGGGTYFELIRKDAYEPEKNDNVVESSIFTDGAEYMGNTPLGASIYQGAVEGNGLEYIYINSKEGWKAELNAEGMFKESITLYKTEDGGKSWNKLTSTDDKNSTIPFASKTGIIFTDSEHGWITTQTPQTRYIGLFRTTDGGVTWEQQALTIPEEYSESEFTTYPPIFFTKKDGLLLSYGFDEGAKQLVYVTHDGGDTWKQTGEQEDRGFQWSYTEQENIGQVSGWSINYNNKTWITTDGLIWKEGSSTN